MIRIAVTAPSGDLFVFERHEVYMINAKKDQYVSLGQSTWLSLEMSTDNINYYLMGTEYKIKKKTSELTVIGVGGLGHVLLKKDDPRATLVQMTSPSAVSGGITIGKGKAYQKIQVTYFKDKPELAQRIADGEFKKLSVSELVKAYND